MQLLLAALLFAAASEGRLPKQISRDPRTVGMGKSCRKNSECKHRSQRCVHRSDAQGKPLDAGICVLPDRKSTRLNSSHGYISYAVFCLKKKNEMTQIVQLSV